MGFYTKSSFKNKMLTTSGGAWCSGLFDIVKYLEWPKTQLFLNKTNQHET